MDDSELIIRIGNQSLPTNVIEIRLHGRAHPNCTDYWDGNWLSTLISVHTGGFRGAYNACLRSEEIAQFLAAVTQLYNAPMGTACFETMEEQLSLTLARDRLGLINVTGEAQDQAGIGNKLKFQFEIDQTFLPTIIRNMEQVLAKFPVIRK